MSPVVVALVSFIVLFLAAFPIWPYSRRWSYGPSGVLGAVILLLAVALVVL